MIAVEFTCETPGRTGQRRLRVAGEGAASRGLLTRESGSLSLKAESWYQAGFCHGTLVFSGAFVDQTACHKARLQLSTTACVGPCSVGTKSRQAGRQAGRGIIRFTRNNNLTLRLFTCRIYRASTPTVHIFFQVWQQVSPEAFSLAHISDNQNIFHQRSSLVLRPACPCRFVRTVIA